MTKQIKLIVAAIIVVILILAGAYYILGKSQKPQDEKTAVQATEAPSAEQSGSIKSLLAMGKDAVCDVSYTVEQNQTSGKVYVSGKKMSSDFSIKTSDGKTMDSHMIQDETYIYSWSSAIPQGTKMKVETVTASPTPTKTGQPASLNIDQQVQYKCSPWGVDSSKFTPPSNVQFLDISAMTKVPGAQTQPSGSGNSSSSYCDQLTDPQAKAACIAATAK
jgi:hypothetical protein